MNWIKENKFLTGFLAVTLIGAGGLAFLVMSAKGRADAAEEHYNAEAAKLTRLQTEAPFPDAGNLEKMQGLGKEHHAAIDELQKNLATTQFPLEATTPAQFQDKLKEIVTSVKARAADKGVKLPEKFYMGFDKYETEPPKTEAAAPLLRMLKSMQTIIELLIDNKATEISELKRDALKEEAGQKEKAELVIRHPFEVKFVAFEGNFHKFINGVVTEKKQFFIPKSVVVKNEKDQGPPRNAPAQAAPAPPSPSTPPPPGTPPTAPGAVAAPEEDVRLVVGDEKLQILVKIDVVDFAEPAAVAKAQK